MSEYKGKSKIERLKKKFWDKYTVEYNHLPDAFDLAMEIGRAQGECIADHTNKFIDKEK